MISLLQGISRRQSGQGFVYLPTQAPWLDDYRSELISFPCSKYDDQVDSTAQALKWIHEAGQEDGFTGFLRSRLKEMYGDNWEEIVERHAQQRRG
jgi:hypothetical protein